MVICKFFLQGNCRFGENCKFEHQLNDNRQQHTSVLRPQNFATNTNVPVNTNTNIDQNTLIRAVINDMVTAEKGGQWLLSCYAPFKEKPNFPGFEEQSFEEVRWGYYEAQRMGTINQFTQQFQMLLQTAVLKLKSLQTPSEEAINIIKSIYSSSPGGSATVFANSGATPNFSNPATNAFGGNQNTLFGNTNPTNVFGQAGNFGNANVFGQNNQQQNATAKSIFSTANQKLFGEPQQQQSSIFGNNQMANNATFGGPSPFGQPSFGNQNQGFNSVQPNQQASPFGQQQSGISPFGAQQQTGTSPFGPQQQTRTSPFNTGASVFHQQQSGISPFVAQQQAGTVGFNTQQKNASPFSIQPQNNSPFLGTQQNTSPFGSQQQKETPFGVQPQNASPFGTQGLSQTPASLGNPSVFGNAVQPAQPLSTLSAPSATHTNSIFGSSHAAGLNNPLESVVDESVYSKIEELSESDIKSFESDSFEFGKIPEKPPTIQMCF